MLNKEPVNIDGAILTPAIIENIKELQEDGNRLISDLSESLCDVITDIYQLEHHASDQNAFNKDLESSEIVKKLHFIRSEFQNFKRPDILIN